MNSSQGSVRLGDQNTLVGEENLWTTSTSRTEQGYLLLSKSAWESPSTTSTNLLRPQENTTRKGRAWTRMCPGKACFQSTDLAIWEELPETSLPVAMTPGCIREEVRVCLNHSWVAQSIHWEEKLASWQPLRSLSLHRDVGRGVCRRLFSTASGKRPKPEDNTEFPRANIMLSKKIKILHLSHVAGQQVTQESTREGTELWSFPPWASPLPALVHNPHCSLSPDLQCTLQWTLQCAGWTGLALTVTGSERCAQLTLSYDSLRRTFSGKEMPPGIDKPVTCPSVFFSRFHLERMKAAQK